MTSYSYITAAVDAVSNYKKSEGHILSYAQRIMQEHNILDLKDQVIERYATSAAAHTAAKEMGKVQVVPYCNSILNAIAVAHDRTIAADTEYKFRGGPAPVAPPIAFLDCIQSVMNKICGLARKDLNGARTEDVSNGIDFTQEHSDLVGFHVDPSHIEDLVDSDLRVLNSLHCHIGQGMPYIDDVPLLRYHAESVKLEDGTWIKDNIADSFTDAAEILDVKGKEYAASQEDLRQGSSATIEFGTQLRDTPDKARTAERLTAGAEQFEKVEALRDIGKVFKKITEQRAVAS